MEIRIDFKCHLLISQCFFILIIFVCRVSFNPEFMGSRKILKNTHETYEDFVYSRNAGRAFIIHAWHMVCIAWFQSDASWVKKVWESSKKSQRSCRQETLKCVIFCRLYFRGKKNASESGTKVAREWKVGQTSGLLLPLSLSAYLFSLSFCFYCCCVQPHSRNDPLDQPGGSLSLVGRVMEELPIKLGTHNIL